MINKIFFCRAWLLFFLLPILIASCKQIDVFEKNTIIPEMKWKSSYKAEGSFSITDTISAYNVFIVIRHTDAYPYNNIWLNASLQPPGDSMQLQRINLPLGNDAHGWEGVGMNDIWEVRKLISGGPKRFIKTGEYKFQLTQTMRDDPLPYIMSVGLRLERADIAR